jgi:parvulin-like peptidyl-prolyl isomerase
MRNHHPYGLLAVVLTSLLLVTAASCNNKPQPTPTVVLPTAAVTTFPTPTNAEATMAGPTLPAQQTAAPTSPPAPTSAAPANTLTPPANAAALVNNQPVPLDEYEAQVALAVSALSQQQSFDPQTTEGQAALLQLRRQILDSMIDQALIEQAAAREGIVVPMEKVETEMSRLIGDDAAKFDDWLKANDMTRESFKAQLQRQLLSAAFQEYIVGSSPPEVEQVHARHILVTTEAEAMDVLIKLRNGESFATLAQEYSQDRGTKDQGGDLGFFPRGVMPAEIELVAFALNPGQVSGIVKSDFGYHIIEVVEKDPKRAVSEEMLTAWRQNKFLEWLDDQRAAAKIEYLVPLQ